MWRAVRLHDWTQTATLVAMVHNTQAKRARPISTWIPPDLRGDDEATYSAEGMTVRPSNIESVAAAFCGKDKRTKW